MLSKKIFLFFLFAFISSAYAVDKNCALTTNEELMAFFQKNRFMIQATAGDGYAGSWLDYDKNKDVVFVLALVKPAQLDESFYCRSRMRVVYVNNTYAYLEEVNKKVVEAVSSREISGVYGVNIDVHSNSVFVYAREDKFQEINAWLKKEHMDNGVIRLFPQDAPTTFGGHWSEMAGQ